MIKKWFIRVGWKKRRQFSVWSAQTFLTFHTPSAAGYSQEQILHQTRLTFLDQDVAISLVFLPTILQNPQIVLGMGILDFIDNFLDNLESTIFYFLIQQLSFILSLDFSCWKVSLLEGMVLGITFMVLRMGSVSILSMRERRCSFCLLISLETTQ